MMISRVLVAPLNWGLGHATRCIPIIDELLANGFEVSLASDGLALELLKDAYPQLRHYTLPAYAIRYGSANMLWNMAWQWPKILRAIYREHQYLKHLVQQTPFDLIISDNRYGCYHAEIKSVILTHQLRIQLPYPALEQIIAKINKTLIDRFDECWIPDFEVSPGLAGQLSHANPPSRYRY
ncbi:MAG: glycosyltransferase, partial [Bacteroidota bacterium]